VLPKRARRGFNKVSLDQIQRNTLTINRPLSREELAELLGMRKGTIERYDREGRIRTILIGNKKRVPPSEVARIVEEGI
jgi:excisionase family DNA binding protein